MKIIIVLSIFFCLSSCDQTKLESKKTSKKWVVDQIKNWQEELIFNGEIGTPCQEDYMKWIAANPEPYYGLPNYIYYKSFDINKDQQADFLLYFPAGNSCTGGHEEGSDFIKLIYSNKDHYLDNSNLRSKIADKIISKQQEKTNQEGRKVTFTITNFTTKITGNYSLWTTQDPDCCASINGTFSYDPFLFEINIAPLSNTNPNK